MEKMDTVSMTRSGTDASWVRALFGHLKSGVAVFEAAENGYDFIFKEFNPAAEAIEKISRHEVIGRRLTEVFPGMRDFGLVDALRRVWLSGDPVHHPARLYKDSRIIGWREYRLYKMPSGEVVALYEEISRRKLVEDRLSRLCESFASFTPECDKNIQRLTATCGDLLGAACAVYGRLHEDCLCAVGQWRMPDNFIPVAGLQDHFCRDVIEQSLGSETYVVPHLDQSRYARLYPFIAGQALETLMAQPVYAFGNMAGAVCVFFKSALVPDESQQHLLQLIAAALGIEEERRHVQWACKESDRKYRFLVDHLQEGLWMIDHNGVTTFVNPSMAKLLGSSAAELAGKPFASFLDETGSAAFPTIMQRLQQGIRYGGEQLFRREDSQLFMADLSLTPLTDDHGRFTGGLATVTDISDRKRAEIEKQAVSEQIRSTQHMESLGVLAGGIAHDFNNLLVGMLGNAELILRDAPADSIVRCYADDIKKSGGRAAELIRQMLSYAGRRKTTRMVLDINPLVREMARLLRVSISQKATLIEKISPDTIHVEGDPTQLRQVAMNLIMNASDALGSACGRITLTTSLVDAKAGFFGTALFDDRLPAGKYACLTVTDTGCGMTPDVQRRIFDPFFTTKDKGHGLGLSAVIGIVRGHRGAIRLESEPGMGSTFSVYLPCTDETPKPAPSASLSLLEWRGEGCILVIDDEEMVLRVIGMMLEKIGFEVIAARDGIQGVEIVKQHPDRIVAVIVDKTMPKFSGEDTLRELKRIQPALPVYLASGYDEKDLASDFPTHELAGFISKPFQMQTVMEKLRPLLKRKVP